MDTRTAVERLEISDCAPFPFSHIYYENCYVGSIGRREQGWYAYIAWQDFGVFNRAEDAKLAVSAWFRGLDIEPGE
jgi:hypothetical protein